MTQCVACNRDPTLGEMLEDPIVRLLMARDGVARPDVENLMDDVTIALARPGRGDLEGIVGSPDQRAHAPLVIAN